MSDLTIKKSVTINELMANLDRYKYNPSNMQRVILEHLDEITNGDVNIVDPTNPFVFLLESSCVNTALAIKENIVNLRSQYPSLAVSEEDLYHHMVDKDYINRFAVPADTTFTMVFQLKELLDRMTFSEEENCYKATIPRDTEYRVDGYTFTTHYPIDFKRYENGVLLISFDGNVESPIRVLSNNITDYIIRRDPNGVDWLFLNVPVSQFKIETHYFPIQRSISFSQNILYDNQFYMVRVFHRGETNGDWKEIKITHSDQVFDPFNPTALVKVYTGYINVSIPIVYIKNETLLGEIRVDVYNTKGAINVDFRNYKFASFSYSYKAINEQRDYTQYVDNIINVTSYSYCDKIVNSGTNGIDFKQLREAVIFNSIGDRQLPITNVQLEANINNKGFELVKNVDVVTNRIFLASKKLPNPNNPKLLTSANISINTFITDIEQLILNENVANNVDRVTIKSNALFINNNGVVSLVNNADVTSLKLQPKSALVNLVNDKNYIYNPYYYVLDFNQREFDVKVYDLDTPMAYGTSFKYQNETLQLPVNTASYYLSKIDVGYKLRIVTKSGNFYKQLANNLVNVQLFFKPKGETNYTYLLGNLVGRTETEERIYEFTIETNYDIDNETDRICLTNTKMFNADQIDVFTELDSTFGILYITNSLTDDYKKTYIDDFIGNFMVPVNSAAVTYETIQLNFGHSLKNLWRRSRSLNTNSVYETYTTDIPLTYTEDVYDIDPVTGSVFKIVEGQLVYNIKHRKGTNVLDNDNNQVFKHRKGDTKLDASGNPIIIRETLTNKELDILFVDGKYYFVNNDIYNNYKKELRETITSWVINDLGSIQNNLLEQTKLYFYPKSVLNSVKVYIDKETDIYIDAEQTFNIEVYVPDRVYKDADLRLKLTEGTVKIIDNYIDGAISVNMTEMSVLLKEFYADAVFAFLVKGLGGNRNLTVCNLTNENNRLSLKKKLVLQQDNDLHVVEDVTVSFYNISNNTI